MNRRSILAGAAALTVAAIPAAPAVAVEEPNARVGRLMDELSEALVDFDQGHWRAVIEPPDSRFPVIMERRLGEAYEVDRALQCLKRAVLRHDMTATGLNVVTDPDGQFLGAVVVNASSRGEVA